ncbi:hypothetical protein Q9233_001951 [Columba guinea]|nr:hypothetical protein Q9233_001951 [Columba guinea]
MLTISIFLQVSVAGYGMDEAEQDQYEARLKELFDSFDSTGTGSLGQEELTDLCHMLHLEEVAPALQQTLLQGNLLGRAPTLKELRFIMPHVKALGSAWWSMRFALLLIFLLDYRLDI